MRCSCVARRMWRCRCRRTGRASSSRSTGPGRGGRRARSRPAPGGIASTLRRRPEHLLVQVVDLAVLDLEVAPERAAQPARLGPALGLGVVQDVGEDEALVRRAAPTRPSRRRSPSARRRGRRAGGRRATREGVTVVSQSAFASSASKNRSTQRPRPSSAPRSSATPPNFSPSSPIVPRRVAVLGRVLAEVLDDVVDLAGTGSGSGGPARSRRRAGGWPWSSVVYGAPEGLLGDGGGTEMRVVEDRPRVAGRGERRRQVRLPDPLREPGAASAGARTCASSSSAIRCELADPVALRQRGEHRLVEAAAQRPRPGRASTRARSRVMNSGRSARSHSSSGPRVVQRHPDGRVALERLEHRQVGEVVDLARTPSRSCRRAGGCGSPGRARCGPSRGGQPALGDDRRQDRFLHGDAGRRQVEPFCVLVEHPSRGEAPQGRRHRAAHDSRPIRSGRPTRRGRSRRARSPPRGCGRDPARRPSPGRSRRGSCRARRSPSRCRRCSPRPTSRRGR